MNTAYENALTAINAAYLAEEYDKYEALIEKASNRFNKAEWIIEDDATDQRFGWDQ